MKRAPMALLLLGCMAACGGGDGDLADLTTTTAPTSDIGNGLTYTLADVQAFAGCDGPVRVVASVSASSGATWLPSVGYGMRVAVDDQVTRQISAIAPLLGASSMLVVDGRFQVARGPLRITLLAVAPEGWPAKWGAGTLSVYLPDC